MPYYLFDKAYRVAESAGVPAHRVVVQSSVEGDCVMPSGEGVGAILGITVHSQPEAGRRVTVRKAGIAEATAAAQISPGTPLMVADATGRVKPVVSAGGGPVNCIGFAESGAAAAGDLVEVFISLHQHTP